MPSSRRLLSSAVLLAAALLPALADDGPTPPAPPAGTAPADAWEQTDRKKMISIRLPKSWKAAGGEDLDPKAVATFRGFLGAEKASPQAEMRFYVESGYARAQLARASILATAGTVKEASLRQAPGWTEGCVTQENGLLVWRRLMEKNGCVFMVLVFAGGAEFDAWNGPVQKLLDTASVPGEYVPAPMGSGWSSKKAGDFDVTTDAGADRESSVKRTLAALAEARDVLMKTLPGKPFDTARPAIAVFQNATKYDDRVKAALGTEVKVACFSSQDRATLVSLISEGRDEFAPAIYAAAARQYTWQYFGGTVPIWLDTGLSNYGQVVALGGGKGKFAAANLTAMKNAAAAGKRRLDQWMDLKTWNDVTDNDQGNNELGAWQVYFRAGRGAKKYKKPFEGYIAALRETGDPAAARKAFDGVNFDEMLKDFRDWAAEWK